MKIASAAYPIDWLEDWDAFEAKLTDWVSSAETDLLVFPEYGAMELISLIDPSQMTSLETVIPALAPIKVKVEALHRNLAREHDCHIVAASAPTIAEGRLVNRAQIYAPDGGIGIQDKQIMTPFERAAGPILSGKDGLKLFDTALGRIGILICYDCEFPLLARSLIEAGADILLIPSCTDTLAGYHRVRIGAQARALEGQCITVQASTVGAVEWLPIVNENVGAGGIFGPPDIGLPDDGVIALGEINKPGWTRGEIDLTTLRNVRREGDVQNFAHWDEQLIRPEVSMVRL
jgi:predicted amidohydrolase